MSNVNDRGTIKWTSLMMPEHIQALNDMWKDQEKKSKPILDEQELEELGMKLQMAIHNDLAIEVKYYKDHDYQLIKGKLSKVDNVNNTLIFQNSGRDKINLSDIIDVTII
ncbi:YolD-like family protein [Oceanobacillus salinisoli]|uniref:YolD-like family protein n=1 Tax=Oceanobacillus salinisoli TaxID=2678611 RepID=UPI0012E23E63|nr:YolD-like family protein [Oceanobacillus salinisoli]